MFCIHFMAERVPGSVYEYLSGTRMLKKVFLNIVSYFFIYVKFDIYKFIWYDIKNFFIWSKKSNKFREKGESYRKPLQVLEILHMG